MAKDSDKIIADQAKEIADLKKQLRTKQEKSSREQVDLSQKLLDIDTAIAAIETERAKTLSDLQDSTKRSAMNMGDLRDTTKQLGAEERRNLMTNIKQDFLYRKILRNQLEIYDLEKKAAPHRKALIKAQHQLNDSYNKYNDSIRDSLNFIDDIKNSIERIPIVGGVLSKALGLDELQDKVADKLTEVFTKTLNPEAVKTAEEAQKALDAYDAQIDALNGTADATADIASNSENITEGLDDATKNSKKFGLGLGAALGTALALYGVIELFKFALKLDQDVTDFARGLGTSKDEAFGINEQLNNIAATSEVIGASSAEFRKEYLEVAKALGVSKLASAEMAETQVYLTKQLGMASDEAANFQSMSKASGRTAYQNLEVIKAGVESMTGGLMSYREVASDIAKSSKSVQASYKGNIVALTKAVITAKKFGMTLDETKKSAEAILDIESSVESEMKANVLTGKHMNLNAARNLALNGKTAEAVEEMMRQAGGYDELMSLAPYKQKAIADSMGMTVDEMIKAAEHQKNLNTMADELGITLDANGKMSDADMQRALASNNEEAKKLALQQQQASVQERLALILENIKATFVSIVDGPLGTILGVFGDIISNAHIIRGVIAALVIVAGSYARQMWNAAAATIANMTAATAGVAALSIAAGLAVVGASLAYEQSKAEQTAAMPLDDAMIGSDGGLIVKGKEGTYRLNKNDSIIAGTDLHSSDSSLSSIDTGGLGEYTRSASSANQGSNNTEIVALLKELIAKVEQPVSINIGGRVIEELESQASMRRSYNTKIDGAYGANG